MTQQLGFAEASYRAIGTLAFIAPHVVLPRVMDQLREDLDAQVLGALTEEELGIWETPEGTTYVDGETWRLLFIPTFQLMDTHSCTIVLATHMKDEGPKKGKDADIARWEAELRQSLASKKSKAAAASGATGLSKEAHALVQAQLAKEAVVREYVGVLRARLVRGLAFVQSVVQNGGTSVRGYVRSIAERLLAGAMSRACARLVGGEGPFETFVYLTQCCSERLEGLRRWVGVAVLRALQVGCIPEEQAAEALGCGYIPSCRFHIRFERMRQQRWCSACSTGSGRSLNKRRWTRPRFRSRSCCSGVLHARVGSALDRAGAGSGIQMGRRGSSRSSSCWT